MEGGAQPASGAESPMPKVDPKYLDLPTNELGEELVGSYLPKFISTTNSNSTITTAPFKQRCSYKG
jgi:hypothetical protein